ncbi:hypothetical protein DSO57_1011962 [Entomophthora muscae]|uniref:Uncharacterized protein n=1 Tax=Entomophthora muscae TaxID=34485 RepID=A0ACC2SUV6_9FUNG|nr:hypothetical protein DSO57_1011962 [Entomophthora muscae]
MLDLFLVIDLLLHRLADWTCPLAWLGLLRPVTGSGPLASNKRCRSGWAGASLALSGYCSAPRSAMN